jgi:archaellum component FlaG (FlaF/FlaG flagellin family)
MADGGASTIIMLVTALLISSAASAVLIQEWSSTSRVIQQQQKGLQLSEQIGIDFAGDPMMVELSSNPNPNEITFFILNTGAHTMDESSLAVLVNGVTVGIIDTDFVPASAAWNPNVLLEVTVSDTSFDTFGDEESITIYATVRSVEVSGISMSTSMTEEVQLNEIN